MKKIMISACLLGINCKYDGQNNMNQSLVDLIKKSNHFIIPVCPEQLGGLTTPRVPCEIILNNQDHILIRNQEGIDVTQQFINGAEECIKIVELQGIDYAILKERSPSCGTHFIYDGSFTHSVIKGQGVLSQQLTKKGLKVISEEDDFFELFLEN